MEHIKTFFRRIGHTLRRPKSERLRHSFFFSFLKVFLAILLIMIVTGSICLMALAVYINRYIDTSLDLNITSTQLNYTTQIYDSDGNEVYSLHGEQNREWVSYEDIPDYLKYAVTSIEDERFWTHRGVDWKRTLGAAIQMVTGFSSSYGGSTITQQLIKNITGDDEVTVQRKLQEILRALELEKVMSKEEILELYLNTINLAEGCYGVQSAANLYFGKDVSELTLAECASIAGITNLPSYYDPFVYPEHNIERQKNILWKMHELGIITDEEYEEAKNEELDFLRDAEEDLDDETETIPSYFIDLVIDDVINDLQDQLGYSKEVATQLLYSGGLQIYTTLDQDVQTVLEDCYTDSSNFQRLAGVTQPQSAMVVYSTTGDILGVVGGRGTKQGARVLNRAKSLRSAGSSIKPLSVYAPALEEELITPNSVVDDYPDLYTDANGMLITDPEEFLEKYDGGDETHYLKAYPKNYYTGYKGLMTIRYAVEKSTNTVAVRVLEQLTLPRSFSYLESKFGISSLVASESNGDMNYGSLALGGFYQGVSLLELVSGYTTFTNNGVHNSSRCYTLITDSEGNTILDNTQRSTQVLSAKANYYINDLLQSVVDNGTGKAAKIDGIATAGKTGTTNADKDRWFVGYTPYYVAGVWYGYDYPKEIVGADGNPALQIWKLVMDELHEDLPDAEFSTEEDVTLTEATFCSASGQLTTSLCSKDVAGSKAQTGTYVAGDEPTESCTAHVSITICTDTGKLATPYCTHTKEVSAIVYHRESLVSGLELTGKEVHAVRVAVPSQYQSSMSGTTSETEVVGNKVYNRSYVYGYTGCTDFCTTHTSSQSTEETDPSIIDILDPLFPWNWGKDGDNTSEQSSEATSEPATSEQNPPDSPAEPTSESGSEATSGATSEASSEATSQSPAESEASSESNPGLVDRIRDWLN